MDTIAYIICGIGIIVLFTYFVIPVLMKKQKDEWEKDVRFRIKMEKSSPLTFEYEGKLGKDYFLGRQDMSYLENLFQKPKEDLP